MKLLYCSSSEGMTSSCCILAILLLCDGNKFFTYLLILTHLKRHSVTIWHWNAQDSVMAVPVLLSTPDLNRTGSMEVLHFSSWHILLWGVLFNGALLLGQLGSKMVCKCNFCPGSSFLINARMAIIRTPLWVKTDSYNKDSALIERL